MFHVFRLNLKYRCCRKVLDFPVDPVNPVDPVDPEVPYFPADRSDLVVPVVLLHRKFPKNRYFLKYLMNHYFLKYPKNLKYQMFHLYRLNLMFQKFLQCR